MSTDLFRGGLKTPGNEPTKTFSHLRSLIWCAVKGDNSVCTCTHTHTHTRTLYTSTCPFVFINYYYDYVRVIIVFIYTVGAWLFRAEHRWGRFLGFSPEGAKFLFRNASRPKPINVLNLRMSRSIAAPKTAGRQYIARVTPSGTGQPDQGQCLQL